MRRDNMRRHSTAPPPDTAKMSRHCTAPSHPLPRRAYHITPHYTDQMIRDETRQSRTTTTPSTGFVIRCPLFSFHGRWRAVMWFISSFVVCGALDTESLISHHLITDCMVCCDALQCHVISCRLISSSVRVWVVPIVVRV